MYDIVAKSILTKVECKGLQRKNAFPGKIEACIIYL